MARPILVTIWHLLANPEARYTGLGYGYARHDTDRKLRNHIRPGTNPRLPAGHVQLGGRQHVPPGRAHPARDSPGRLHISPSSTGQLRYRPRPF